MRTNIDIDDTVLFVDSAVWIDFFNGAPSPARATLRRLLAQGEAEISVPDLVLYEVLRGLRHERDDLQAEALMQAMTVAPPAAPHWPAWRHSTTAACAQRASRCAAASTCCWPRSASRGATHCCMPTVMSTSSRPDAACVPGVTEHALSTP